MYADGYICIADSFPSRHSSTPVSVIDARIALIPSGITAAVLPQGKTTHPIAKTVDSVCVCVVCRFQGDMPDSTPLLLPPLWREQGVEV